MIKKLTVLLIAFILCAGVFVFPACGKEELLSLEYENSVVVQFLDPCGTFYVNTALGYQTEYNGVTYKFDKALTEEERNRTVTETSACFELLEERVGALEENYTVYVVDDYYVPYTDGNNLYFGYENIKTAEFATAVVQLVYGRDVNYGVLYGLGASIASERGYKNSLTNLKKALSLYETAPEYLDLNYACFLDKYADKATVKKVKTLSIEFYKFLETGGKTDLLTEYSDIKRRSYFNEFLAANGKGEYNSDELDGISFYGGGKILRLMWENEYAKFELYDDFNMGHKNGSLGKDPLNCGYADLRRHIVNFEAQMHYTRERLAAYNASPQKVTAKFTNNLTDSTTSFYDINSHTIYLTTIISLMHEYTHSILNCKYRNSIIVHSLVYYFSNYPVDESISYEIVVEHDYFKDVYGTNFKKYTEFVDKLTEKLGHKINLFDKDDYIAFNDYISIYTRYAELFETEMSGYAQISFINYAFSQYGEEAVCEAAFADTPVEVLGESWSTIISEWRTYLEENCVLDI